MSVFITKLYRRLRHWYRHPYVRTPSIIMLGDSLIEQGNWHELLDRKDLLNRGVGGDRLRHIQFRMKWIRSKSAKIIFIEGGINDLPQSDMDDLFVRYQKIVSFWQTKGVIPIIVGLVFLSPMAAQIYPSRRNWTEINSQVSRLNEKLKNFCAEKDIDFLDLNSLLSNPTQLLDGYHTDGLHLTVAAYQIWASAVTPLLQKHQV